jgi:hypothetical protein
MSFSLYCSPISDRTVMCVAGSSRNVKKQYFFVAPNLILPTISTRCRWKTIGTEA